MLSMLGYMCFPMVAVLSPSLPPPRVFGPPSARLRVHYPQPRGGPRLRIPACGVREWMAPGMVDRPRGTDAWLLVHFRHPVVVATPAGPAPAPAGSLIVWQPHAPHLLGSLEHPWCHSWLYLEGEDAHELLHGSDLPLDRPVPLANHRWLDRLVLTLHEEGSLPEPDGEILRSHLAIFLRQVRRDRRDAPSGRIPRDLLALRDHLDATFAQAHALPRLAARLGCSVPHLCTRFRAAFGTSPIAYVVETRLRHAHLLLRDRHATVAAVAQAVGYDDYHHFSKLFHRRFGRWPSAVRDPSERPAPPGAALARGPATANWEHGSP